MKGIVLAGGTGSRLYPLTKVTNKHLLPVGTLPMIYYPIKKLVEAGIEEILIVTGVEHMGNVVSLLGSGKELNCQLTYKVQDAAGGIAQALGLAENFVGNNEQMSVILGDNIFENSLKNKLHVFSGEAKLFLKEVEDPQRYGVVEFGLNGKIIKITEKPDKPKTKFIVVGIYVYGSEVFECIHTLHPSKRGELEITEVNNWYVCRDRCNFEILNGFWSDAGTFDSLINTNNYIWEDTKHAI
jgi:glucose-1-phosphate thymidylyltransferase